MSESPWRKTENKTTNLSDIMSEQYAHYLHDKEVERQAKKKIAQKGIEDVPTVCGKNFISDATSADTTQVAASGKLNDNFIYLKNYSKKLNHLEKSSLPAKIDPNIQENESFNGLESDAVIAQMLQSQFDHQYNRELRSLERHRNKASKVTVSLDKYCRNGDIEFLDDTEIDYEEDEIEQLRRDWDRFETNEKKLDAIPKCGFKLNEEGSIITKHDPQLCGVRNACRVMLFPPGFPTGDAAGFEMKLSNQVFNQLKNYSRRGSSEKRSKMHNRRENLATAEMGVDGPTRLLLYKLINNQVLEQINGIISTGKEAIILHAYSDQNYMECEDHYPKHKMIKPPRVLPKECAIKIFKTTLNEFKQRDRYIKDDFRFKERFCKQNNRCLIQLWAEKEMHNLMRMQSIGVNVPNVVLLKKHVLVMSFIGNKHNAAPKLKDSILSDTQLEYAFAEVVAFMRKLYVDAKLVHADLSEYNILWYDDKCWFIDVAQSVESEHPSALEFLMRDCENVIKFFYKRGLRNIYSKEKLFEFISDLNAETYNVAMLERIHTRGAPIDQASAPYQDNYPEDIIPIEYPFNLPWNKSKDERYLKKEE